MTRSFQSEATPRPSPPPPRARFLQQVLQQVLQVLGRNDEFGSGDGGMVCRNVSTPSNGKLVSEAFLVFVSGGSQVVAVISSAPLEPGTQRQWRAVAQCLSKTFEPCRCRDGGLSAFRRASKQPAPRARALKVQRPRAALGARAFLGHCRTDRAAQRGSRARLAPARTGQDAATPARFRRDLQRLAAGPGRRAARAGRAARSLGARGLGGYVQHNVQRACRRWPCSRRWNRDSPECPARGVNNWPKMDTNKF